MKKLITFLGSLLLAANSLVLNAQSSVIEQWVQTYVNADSIQDAAIEVDAHHCIFVLGTSIKAGDQNDLVLLRFAKDGTLLWTAEYDNPFGGGDRAADLIVDKYCNAYVLATHDSLGYPHTTLLKFDSSGTKVWEVLYNYPGSILTIPNRMALDSGNNLIVTGYKQEGLKGFIQSALTVKFDGLGNLLWEKIYDPLSFGSGSNAIVTDNTGNIYITGWYRTSDMNNDDDIIVVKYDPDGNLVWSQTYEGSDPYSDLGMDIHLDMTGNIYVGGNVRNTGTEQDWVILKYSPSGSLIWDKTINGTNNQFDFFNALLVTGNNIYATGTTDNTGQNNTGTLVRFDSNGNLLWKNEREFYSGRAIATGLNGEIYQLNIYSLNTADYNVTAFDQAGNILWEHTYDGVLHQKDVPTSFSVDNENNVYVTGNSVVAESGKNIVVGIVTVKYGLHICNLTAFAGNDTVIFAGQSVQIGSAPIPGNTYSWSPSEGLSDVNISNPLATPQSSTIYSVIVTDSFGCTDEDEIKMDILNSGTTDTTITFFADISHDSVIRIVWDKTEKINISKYILEKSIDNVNYVFIDSISSDSIIDTPDTLVKIAGILYSAETGNIRLVYIDTESNIELLIKLKYRVKMIDNNGNYFYTKTAQIMNKAFPATQFLACPPVETPPNGYFFTGNVYGPFLSTDLCCVITQMEYQNSAGCMNPSPSEIGTCGYIAVGNGTVDCSCLCDCTFDRCCKHNCYNINGIPDGNGGYLVDSCTCDSWQACSGSCDKKWIVSSVTPFELAIVIGATKTSICSGGSTTLSASGFSGMSFTWSPSTGLNTTTGSVVIASPATTTTYTVTGTIGNCSASGSITITVFPEQGPSVSISVDDNCQPGSITANVTNGTSPFTYSWLSGETTPTITATAIGTQAFQVTVSDANGCTDEDYIVITIHPSPSVTIKSATNACSGQNDGLVTAEASDGTPPYSFLWSNGSTASDISGLAPGTYSVTVTDANGCTASASAVVGTYPSPAAPVISGFNNNCPAGPSVYTVTNQPAGATYSWVTTFGSPASGTGPTANITWSNIPDGQTGSITFTVTDANGCTNSSTLTVFPCCSVQLPPSIGGIDYYLNNISCANSFTYYDKNIVINGTYTICQGAAITFQGCRIFLGPDAKIVISNNAILKCINSATKQTILKAGCDYMWDGIYLEVPACSLLVNGSAALPTLIQDAKNAVVSKKQGKYRITNAKFDLNLRSIVQQNDALAAVEIIASNQFMCSATPLPYWENNTVKNAARSISHIEFTDVLGTGALVGNNGSSNSFSNADNGIVCRNSIVNVIKNTFQNFTLSTGFTGNAIIAVTTQLTVGGSLATKNTFSNCYGGVLSILPRHTTVTNNEFTMTENGITVSNFWSTGANVTVSLLANVMTSYRYGISVYEMPQCTLKINNNTLNQNYSPFNSGTGMRVWNSQQFKISPTPEIKDNTIDGNAGSYIDIHTVLVRNALIKGNTIAKKQTNFIIKATGATYYGIKAESCPNAQISNNTVTRPNSTAFTNFNQYLTQDPDFDKKIIGISIENSPANIVAKNTVQRFGSGIHAKDICTNSKLFCNTLDNCYNGFFLNNASIGNQGSAGGKGQPGLTSDNVWTDLGQTGDNRILYQIPSPSINWYYKNNPTSYVPTNGAGISAIPPIQGTIQFLTSSGISGCNIYLKSPDALEREEMFGRIVRNEKTFDNHEPEFKIHEKEITFRELKEDGWLQLDSPDDTLFQNFVDSIQLTNTGKFDDVRKAIEQNDLSLAGTKNSSITPTHLIEENRKTVNEIYLQAATTNKTKWDVMETAILEGIACQDPLEGGEAVYSARVMLRRSDICQSSAKMAIVSEGENEEGNETIQQEAKSLLIGKIYPKPNSGNMQLDYQLEAGQNGKLLIYDIAGRNIRTYSLLNENNSLKISDAALTNGIYFYEIVVDNTILFKDKLIIIK